jgi:cephalosporin hydroxylase
MLDKELATRWHNHMLEIKYSYNFSWLGRQIIQEPQDIVGLQEVIWNVKPDLIIETGIAHGGSLVLSASMLALLDIEKYIPNRKAIGVDIEIREHNLKALSVHPLRKYFQLFESSSTNEITVDAITRISKMHETVMVILDSDHTHNHVLAELEVYAPLVTKGSYCVVFDTGIEDTPPELCFDRPWGKGNSPGSARSQYLKEHPGMFEIDTSIDAKMAPVSNPESWLRRI